MNGTLVERKKICRCINGKLVVVWDIGDTPEPLTGFITTWSLSAGEFTFPAIETTAHTGQIDWGDGSEYENYSSDTAISHTYAENGNYTITINAKIETINKYTFENELRLLSVQFPKSVLSINALAFSHCENLSSVSFENGISYIGNFAFEYCSGLYMIIIPDSVTDMGRGVFDNCTNLKYATLSSNLSVIPDYTFYNCKKLSNSIYDNYGYNVTIPAGITEIGLAAFGDCVRIGTYRYMSTADDWRKIKKGTNNQPFQVSCTDGRINFYS